MSMPSIDSYIQETLDKNISQLLNNSNILKSEVLSNIEPDTRDSFINTYCTDVNKNALEIPVLFTYPATGMDKRSIILIQFKSSSEPAEDSGSLGSFLGTTDTNQGEFKKEKLVLKQDLMANGEPYAYVETSFPIYQEAKITEISDNNILRVEGNKIYISWTSIMKNAIGSYVTVIYNTNNEVTDASTDLDSIGYDLEETYAIDVISSNMDTLRCLDLLLKTCLAVMRQNPMEQSLAKIQSLSFNGVDLIQEINTSNNSLNGNQLYYRRALINYLVPYSVDINQSSQLRKVMLDN